jgi:hypothetical protein
MMPDAGQLHPRLVRRGDKAPGTGKTLRLPGLFRGAAGIILALRPSATARVVLGRLEVMHNELLGKEAGEMTSRKCLKCIWRVASSHKIA